MSLTGCDKHTVGHHDGTRVSGCNCPNNAVLDLSS